MKTEYTELALFDLDGTLLEGDSELAWSDFLARKGLIDPAECERNAQAFEQAYHGGMLDERTFLAFHLAPVQRLKQHPRSWFDTLSREFQQHVVPEMIRPGARALVARHLEAGALVALVTATNSFITGPIARTLGIGHVVATVLEQDSRGAFTGNCSGRPAFREGKIERVEHWLASLGMHHHAFRRSVFYSDSINDLPMLEWVRDPVVVTPDATLADIARRRGWSTLDCRSL